MTATTTADRVDSYSGGWRGHLGSLGTRGRILCGVLFLVLTLPCLTVLGVTVPGLRFLWPADMALRSIPLTIAVGLDQTWGDGGELSPDWIPVWVALTGVQWWPLAALALWPRLWSASNWRRGILCYGGCLLLGSIAAASWIFTHLGYFF